MDHAAEMHPLGWAQYTQVKVTVAPELAAAFKAACTASGSSMVSVISSFMEAYSKANAPKKGHLSSLSTKRQRRAAVQRILDQLVLIRDNEEKYKDNIPDNLQGSEAFHLADCCVSQIDEAIEALESAY